MLNPILLTAICAVVSFFIGAIPFGLILGRVFNHTDIRKAGSGNIGTTNAMRTMGKVGGSAVFVLDFGKGIVSGLIAAAAAAMFGGGMSLSGHVIGYDDFVTVAFLGCVWGHIFSPWLGFKGGKGIATSFGCLLIVFPLQTLCAFGVFLLLVATTRYVSAGSLGAAVTLPFFIMFTTPCDPVIWCSVIAICLLAIWRHYPNIKRLMNHTESKLNLGKKKNA